jgi:hypothetical protein
MKVYFGAAFLLVSAFGSSVALADKLDPNGILVDDTLGNVHTMSESEAMRACPKNTHLPTARELAKMAAKRGANGILELNQIKPGEPAPEGYYLVDAVNPDGNEDRFYFSNHGYKPIVSPMTLDNGESLEPRTYILWSSSVNAKSSAEADGGYDLHDQGRYHYQFDNVIYEADHLWWTRFNAGGGFGVMCIPDLPHAT